MTSNVDAWKGVVREALQIENTPFYLFQWTPTEQALSQLERIASRVPIRHWLSMKTHPLGPLLREWRRIGRGVEVVSRYELQAALAERYAPADILVNGVLKHIWLRHFSVSGLRVHFDSNIEVESLASAAKRLDWSVGLRLHVSEAFDPDEPKYPSQFGMTPAEAHGAVTALAREGLTPDSIHFHLRSNVFETAAYTKAIEEVAEICKHLHLSPAYLDVGGGFPTPGEVTPEDTMSYPDLTSTFGAVIEAALCLFPNIREVWMENGRYLTGRSGVLVITVCDVKQRDESRFLICDGGRTNHALVSDWERHDIVPLEERAGCPAWTTIAGPTCMAFDRLDRRWLPNDITVGDHLIWTGAGAYHLPWETRFSHGHAPVLWKGAGEALSVARDREPFESWWGQWRIGRRR